MSPSYPGRRRGNPARFVRGFLIIMAIVTVLLLMLRHEIFSSSESAAEWYANLRSSDKLQDSPLEDIHSKPKFTDRSGGSVPLQDLLAGPMQNATLKPFYLHYIRFKPDNKNTELKFTDFLSVMSGVQYLKPDGILIHGDFTPTGPHWDNLTSRNLIRQVPMVRPTDVGIRQGKPKKLGFIEHSADIAKLDVLLKHGGIAVDFDVFFVRGQHIKDILQSKKSITCYGDRDGNNIGLVAGRQDSKFLWAWRRSYRDVYVGEWNFNQAFISTYLTALFPEDVYVLDHVCNNPHPDRDLNKFFHQYGKIEWKNSAAIHSYERHGGVSIQSSEDLFKEPLTTHKEMLQYIYFNRSLPPIARAFKDEVFAAP
ncbi:hypothetical protein RvY_11940 [Ramazzottius varieornatus]|uniref:Alpha-1,4-N-acetylglucosaminyltransferase n=1 Tax=Ramazzottius varieornatus TaxID=947166 RepID=A0A1D1VHU4_RAMVA|nr:hypothetical protein RvY_11940 [Ramazzottius varieornatus]